jgi:hypothetical protein
MENGNRRLWPIRNGRTKGISRGLDAAGGRGNGFVTPVLQLRRVRYCGPSLDLRRIWVCVLNPGEETFKTVQGLLAEAYDMAIRKHTKTDPAADA